MSGKITLVIPEAPVPAAAPAAKQRAAKSGALRLGLLDNSKGNADHLLKFVLEGLKGKVEVGSVVSLRKGSVSLPAPKEILDQFVAEADLVVSAMAD
jgi:hypothetical protein